MKTVGEFKKAGVVFVKGDECQEQPSGRIYRNNWFGEDSQKQFTNDTVTSFAWRDLTTKPDPTSLRYKIELDIDNHRWRPSLNQGIEYPYEQRVTFRDEYMEYLENARKDGITKPMTRVEYVKHLAGVAASAVATDSGDEITILHVDRKASEAAQQPEFKVGDLVEVDYGTDGKYFVTLTYLDNKSFVGYVDEWLTGNSSDKPLMAYLDQVHIKPYNPKLNELKDIIGLHDDPTECAKAILAAGYTK